MAVFVTRMNFKKSFKNYENFIPIAAISVTNLKNSIASMVFSGNPDHKEYISYFPICLEYWRKFRKAYKICKLLAKSAIFTEL